MKKLSFVLSVIFLTSCGKLTVPHDINPYFQPFLTHFKQDADEHSIAYGDIDSVTVISFDKLNNYSHIAECQFIDDWDKFGNEIRFKKISFQIDFKNFSLDYQYQIFLHEIGHCFYHLIHSPKVTYIMHDPTPYIFPQNFPFALNDFFDLAVQNKDSWFSYSPL